jgi:hypothetical protein
VPAAAGRPGGTSSRWSRSCPRARSTPLAEILEEFARLNPAPRSKDPDGMLVDERSPERGRPERSPRRGSGPAHRPPLPRGDPPPPTPSRPRPAGGCTHPGGRKRSCRSRAALSTPLHQAGRRVGGEVAAGARPAPPPPFPAARASPEALQALPARRIPAASVSAPDTAKASAKCTSAGWRRCSYPSPSRWRSSDSQPPPRNTSAERPRAQHERELEAARSRAGRRPSARGRWPRRGSAPA